MSMKSIFDIKDSADLLTVISDYFEKALSVSQLDPSQKETLSELYERVLKTSRDGKYPDHNSYDAIRDVNIHIVAQTWGSTAGGWSGMGGSAMSTYYTFIIESKHLSAAFIYFGSRLCYICDMDDQYRAIKEYRMPSQSECKKQLKIFYRK